MAALAAMLLSACAGTLRHSSSPVAEQNYQLRQQSLADHRQWLLSGKLSVDDGQDGGSGRLRWEVGEESTLLAFRGALGKGAWQLEIGPHQARLSKADGGVSIAEDIDSLIHDELGWAIPVAALQWWVLGISAPGDVELLELDELGQPLRLVQHGWAIEYSRYRDFDGFVLPSRLEATMGERRVKLALASWVPVSAAHD